MCEQYENERRFLNYTSEKEAKERDEGIASFFHEMGEEIGHDKALKLLAEILYD